MSKFNIMGRTLSFAPQTAQVFKHLADVGSVSGVEAQAIYKVRSLTKRISEINDELNQKLGPAFTLQAEWLRDATGQRYRRYFMAETVRGAITHANLPAVITNAEVR